MIRITISPLWAIIYTAAAIAVCVGLCLADRLWVRIALVAIVLLDKAALLRHCYTALRRMSEIVADAKRRRYGATRKGTRCGIPNKIYLN